MPNPTQNLATRLYKIAWNHLSEWDIRTPLQLTLDLDDEGEVYVCHNPEYPGFSGWAHRMNVLHIDQLPDLVIQYRDGEWKTKIAPTSSTRFADVAAVKAIVAEVDYIALMENAALSLGLMMTYDGLRGDAAEQLFCLHRFDVLQRLVSATDRLRAALLHSLFGFTEREVAALSRTENYECAFNIQGDRLLKTLRAVPESNRIAFGSARKRMWKFVCDGDAPIRKLRRRRNDATHVLGTIPGVRQKKRARDRSQVQVPHLGSVYADLGHAGPSPDEFAPQIKVLKGEYENVLDFGSTVFELDNLISEGTGDSGPETR